MSRKPLEFANRELDTLLVEFAEWQAVTRSTNLDHQEGGRCRPARSRAVLSLIESGRL